MVDYGEQELCGEKHLLHVAEYQEYTSCNAPFCSDIINDRLDDPTSVN